MNDQIIKLQRQIKILNLIGLFLLVANTVFATVYFMQGKTIYAYFSVFGAIACLYVLIKSILKKTTKP